MIALYVINTTLLTVKQTGQLVLHKQVPVLFSP